MRPSCKVFPNIAFRRKRLFINVLSSFLASIFAVEAGYGGWKGERKEVPKRLWLSYTFSDLEPLRDFFSLNS